MARLATELWRSRSDPRVTGWDPLPVYGHDRSVGGASRQRNCCLCRPIYSTSNNLMQTADHTATDADDRDSGRTTATTYVEERMHGIDGLCPTSVNRTVQASSRVYSVGWKDGGAETKLCWCFVHSCGEVLALRATRTRSKGDVSGPRGNQR